MTDQHEIRDVELGRALETIAVPPAATDLVERARERALEPSGSRRLRRSWRLVLAGVAAAVAVGVTGGFVGAAVTQSSAHALPTAPVLAFAPAAGWNSVVAPLPTNLQSNNQVAWASNVPFKGEDLTSGWPNETVKALPADGVAIFASLAHKVDDASTYPDRALPLELSDGYLLSSGYEGQPAPNVSLQLVYAHVRGQYVLVQVWFGRLDPTEAQRRAADAELARLAIPSAG